MRAYVRSCITSVLVILSAGYHNSAQADLSEAEAKKILAMHPEPQMLAQLEEQFPIFKKLAGKRAPLLDTAAGPAGATKITKSPPINGADNFRTAGVHYLLRSDWSDLGLLGVGCFGPVGVPVDKAKGASVSFTQDYVADNRIWAAQAMGAAVYSECDLSLHPRPGGGDSGFIEKSLGIYTAVHASYNSNAQVARKSNLDTRTAGLSAELIYLHNGDYHGFRFTPNVVQDAIKGTTVVAFMGQYIPLWVSYPGIWHNVGIFNNSVNFQFDPTLDLQYASTTDRKNPVQFSGMSQSLRIGPELTFIVKPLAAANNFLSHIGLNETFHPWYEVYSGHSSYWWANSVFYNITDDGNFAVALSYNRGLDENSGAMTNQYVLSLSGKY